MNIALTIFIAIIPVFAVLGVWIGSFYDKRYANALYKLHMLRTGFGHMLLSTDKKFPKKTPDPGHIVPVRRKRIVFVRHGESTWNYIFNKGFGADFPYRLLSSVHEEGKLFPTLDSVFLDSPLSVFGTTQATELRHFVNTSPVLKSYFETESCVLVSSNLRRALSTATIAFYDQIKKNDIQINVLSNLQEVTFNLDGLSLAKPFSPPVLSETELTAIGKEGESGDMSIDKYFNCDNNTGDKPIKSCGFDRLLSFCEWVFSPECQQETVIATGHSLYFRYFFRYFLPEKSKHFSKTHKMTNCSVVSFDLEYGNIPNGEKGQERWFRIIEDSIDVLYLGFEVEKAKKKVTVTEEVKAKKA